MSSVGDTGGRPRTWAPASAVLKHTATTTAQKPILADCVMGKSVGYAGPQEHGGVGAEVVGRRGYVKDLAVEGQPRFKEPAQPAGTLELQPHGHAEVVVVDRVDRAVPD